MSLILDALRKMEQERKAKSKGTVDIRPDVLSYRGAPPKPARNRFLPAAIALLLISVLVTAGLLLRGGKSEPQIHPAEPVARSVVTPEIQPASLPTPPIQPPQAAPVPVRTAPAVAQPIHSPKKAEADAPPVASTEPAGSSNITISGIAWQDERNMRRAVINGVLVSEGTEIAGARIVEIKENRVKFSRDGQTFEVIYSSAFPR